mmetsp:Transcript_98477/g.287189  ORF Transcript_98477/g.287189 Transcript_98477/m.287189 type:complete len:229 (-) Transcript_98477:442-1128(-)
MPDTGLPHELGSCKMLRRRTVKALLQVAVQTSQSCQSAHCPSMQSSPHVRVLQGAASLFVRGWHAAPPFFGIALIMRLRCVMPPPQLAEHSDQSYHSLHWQSVWGHSPALPRHGKASSNEPWHPSLKSACGFTKERWRVTVPLPHSAEQPDHSDQSESSQGSVHGCTLHAFNSLNELSGQLPPWLGGDFITRVLNAWPPPHSLLHMGGFASRQPRAVHSLHSESWQGS